MDVKERAKIAAVATVVVEQAKLLCQENPDAKFLVHQFEASSNTKALDFALKQMKTMNVQLDNADSEKISCLACQFLAETSGNSAKLDVGNGVINYIRRLDSVEI